MSENITKYTALALAAVMILSVVSLPVAAQPAVSFSSSEVPDSVSAGETFTITYDLTNSGDEDAGAGGIQVFTPEGVTVTSVEGDGAGEPGRFFVGGIEAGETKTVTYTFSVADDVSGDITVEAEGTVGTDRTEETSDTISAEENGGEPEPEPGDFPLGPVTVTDGGLFFVGQTLETDAYDDGDQPVLRQDPGDDNQAVRELEVGDDGTLSVDTSGLPQDDYRIVSSSGSNIDFELVTQDYDVSARQTTVDNSGQDTETAILATSNRRAYTHVLTVEDAPAGVDEAALQNVLGLSDVNSEVSDIDNDGAEDLLIRGSTRDEFIANFSGAPTGDYTIDFEVADTGVSQTLNLTVTRAVGDATFTAGSNVVTEQVGDYVLISIGLDNTRDAAVTIGSEDVNYEVDVSVRDNDDPVLGDGEVGDDTVLLVWDTSEAGVTDQPASSAFFVLDSNPDARGVDEIADIDQQIDPQEDDQFAYPLDAGGYPLSISVASDRKDVGTVNLQASNSVPAEIEAENAPARLDLLPDGDTTPEILGNTQPDDVVALNDYLAFDITASGVHSYINGGNDLADSGTNGVFVQIAETGQGVNVAPDVATISDATLVSSSLGLDDRLLIG